MKIFHNIIIVLLTLSVIALVLLLLYCFDLWQMRKKIARDIKEYSLHIELRYGYIFELLTELGKKAEKNNTLSELGILLKKAQNASETLKILRYNQRITIKLNELKYFRAENPQLEDNERMIALYALISSESNSLFHYKQKINDTKLLYNYKFSRFPASIFSLLIGLKQEEYFVIVPNELER